jgi:cytochrome o ubiquinol oxidase subunit 2
MNSFWIPSLGGQIMVMPGMTTQMNLMADGVGSYHGFSGNISGQGFSGMTFMTNSVSSDDFAAWVEEARKAPSTLTQASYAALAAPSSYVPVSYYSSVEQGLFDSILAQYMATSSSAMDMMGMPMDMP